MVSTNYFVNSAGDIDRVRRSPLGIKERTACRFAFVFYFSRRRFWTRDFGGDAPALFLTSATMVATHVPHHRRRSFTPGNLGNNYIWCAMVAAALFSKSIGRVAKPYK